MSELDAVELSFDQALAQLEQIAQRLEQEELPLEESLKLFEQGVALARLCNRQLDNAERKIELLTARDGKPLLSPAPELEIDEGAEDATA